MKDLVDAFNQEKAFSVIVKSSQRSVASSTCIFCVRSVAREIIKEDGVGRGGLLGKGITATMGRNGFFNMVPS